MIAEYGRVDIDHNPLGNASQFQAQISDFRERVHRLRFVAAVPFWCRAHFGSYPGVAGDEPAHSHSLANRLPLSPNSFLIIVSPRHAFVDPSLFQSKLTPTYEMQILRVFNRCQDVRPHRLATHACDSIAIRPSTPIVWR